MWRIGVAALVLAALLAAAPARAADPGRWKLTGTTSLPIVYYQGVTTDPARSLFFDGVFVGLYRTDPAFHETGRTDDVIPPDVHAREGYNHIGDISWDRAEGGRILLPLECYVPNGPNGGNPCLHGSIGVADPAHAAVALLREARPAPRSRRRCGTRSRPTARCCGPRAATTCSPIAPPTSRSPTPRPGTRRSTRCGA